MGTTIHCISVLLIFSIALKNTFGDTRMCANENITLDCGQIGDKSELLGVYWKIMGTTVSSYLPSERLLNNYNKTQYIMDNTTFSLLVIDVTENTNLSCAIVTIEHTDRRSRNIVVYKKLELAGCNSTVYTSDDSTQLVCSATNLDQVGDVNIKWTSSSDLFNFGDVANIRTSYKAHVLTSTISFVLNQLASKRCWDHTINCELHGPATCGQNQSIVFNFNAIEYGPNNGHRHASVCFTVICCSLITAFAILSLLDH